MMKIFHLHLLFNTVLSERSEESVWLLGRITNPPEQGKSRRTGVGRGSGGVPIYLNVNINVSIEYA